jgi:hypothetical protein
VGYCIPSLRDWSFAGSAMMSTREYDVLNCVPE